jgi:hypothetical protein
VEDVLVMVATNLSLVAVEPNLLIAIFENVTEKIEVEVEDVKFVYGVVLGTANMEGISMRIASGVVDTTDNLYSLVAPVAREITPVPKKADTFCGCRFLAVMEMKGKLEITLVEIAIAVPSLMLPLNDSCKMFIMDKFAALMFAFPLSIH